ncbi:Uncharacterized protein APZ42_019107 [Daphnia magna]|uniref:Uncharacterized protein n=1 Tax=Daphnia magna TaxID=35525 RepID=A0A164YKJ4_9CRUS|nr:Uncharacterized protein APZ42_019107 [Daphnia magna]
MLLIEIKKKRIKKTERKKSGCKKSNCLLIVQMSASQKQQSKGGGRGIVNGVRIENGDTSGRCLSTRLCRVVRSRQPEGENTFHDDVDSL